MARDKPMWKGVHIDRDFLRETLRARFLQMGKGNMEENLGGLINDLERYLTAELILNTKEMMDGITGQLQGASKFLDEYAAGIDETIIKRRAQQLAQLEDEAQNIGG